MTPLTTLRDNTDAISGNEISFEAIGVVNDDNRPDIVFDRDCCGYFRHGRCLTTALGFHEPFCFTTAGTNHNSPYQWLEIAEPNVFTLRHVREGMTTNSFDGIDPASITPDDTDDSDVRVALSSSNPLVRRRGVELCETLAEQDIDTVRPFLDRVASLAGDSTVAVALRAISTLHTVVESDGAALEGRVSGLVGALDTDVVDVQLTAGSVLGKLVVERPDLLAPYTGQLIEAVRATEPDPGIRDFGSVVNDRQTRRTLQEHEEAERQRQISARRTLINVVVAITETHPPFNVVDDLIVLLEDRDPAVTGGAVDALGELAAANPDVVAPASDRLIDCLDHDRTVVRARAVRALGYLGESGAVPKLRAVGETDDDEDVRELAAETADFLASAS